MLQLHKIFTNFNVADRIAPLLASSKNVEGNPRIVKRMLNVIAMRQVIAGNRQMPIDIKLIAKTYLKDAVILNQYRPYTIEINATADGKPELFEKLSFKEDFRQFITKWLGEI